MTLFDSHCHLTDDRLAAEADAVVERARAAGLVGMVTIASSLEDAERALAIAERHPDVWATAGVHPHEAARVERRTLDALHELLQHERAVAVGETGLDYHYDNSPRAVQRRVFDAQLGIAAEHGVPVVVHAREADDDVVAAIRQAEGAVTGVLHCFSSGAALLDAALEAGWMVSFAGLVSFAKYDGADLLRSVPAERILFETDSPYLAPVPHRGKTNEPAFVRHVVEAAARMREADVEELAAVATANALCFYGIGQQ
ncbi:MAG TPA: TatD family hydrolase [Longimicrobiales bacterium]